MATPVLTHFSGIPPRQETAEHCCPWFTKWKLGSHAQLHKPTCSADSLAQHPHQVSPLIHIPHRLSPTQCRALLGVKAEGACSACHAGR